MRFRGVLAAACGVAAFCGSTSANATVGYCIAYGGGLPDQLTPVFEFPERDGYFNIHYSFERYVENETERDVTGNCSGFDSEAEAADYRSRYLSNMADRGKPVAILEGFADYLAEKPKTRSASKTSPKPIPKSTPSQEAQAPSPPRKTKAEYDAEFALKQEKYERDLAEQRRKVEEFERAKQDVAQKKDEQRIAAQRVLDQFKREQAEHAQRLLEHQDAQRRYALCLAGDQSACAAGGQPTLAKADPGEASTDDDARQCVTEPVVSNSKTWANAMQAVVFNGCTKPVDVRICFLRSGGKWNCGVQWAIQPQDKWTWWSTETGGEIFWDARTAGVNRPLGSPS